MLKGSKSGLDRLSLAAKLRAVGAVVVCAVLAAALWTSASAAEADGDAAKPAEAKAEPKADNGELKAEFYVDFRGAKFDRDRLVPLGVDTLYAWRLLNPEPKGLRITVPDHQGEKKPYLGVAPLVTIHGDFEITASYEILTLDRPQGHSYPGASLELRTEKMQKQAGLRRCIMPDGVDAYRVRILAGAKAPEAQEFPAQGKTGKLRLVRTGEIVEYSVAEGQGNDFRILARGAFGASPIALLRLDVSTGGSRTTADVLWKDLKIRAVALKPVDIPLLRAGKD